LTNTLHELKWDGRFSYANKHWAEKIYIPTDLIHNSDFVVRSHPAVLDGFVSFYRKAVQALNLFGAEHCVGDRAEQDFAGKVLVAVAGYAEGILLESGGSTLVCSERLWMRAAFQWSSSLCHLPLGRRNSQMDPGGFHRCAGRKMPAGLGAGEARGADRTTAGGTGHR